MGQFISLSDISPDVRLDAFRNHSSFPYNQFNFLIRMVRHPVFTEFSR